MAVEVPSGQQIQTRRKAVGISQTDLASQLRVTTAYISKVEAGHTFSSDEMCSRIASALSLAEPATRTLRATALKERTGLKVEDICPHVKAEKRQDNLTGYELTALEAIRSLDDYSKHQALDFLMWLQERKVSSTERPIKQKFQWSDDAAESMARVIDEFKSIAEKEAVTEDDVRSAGFGVDRFMSALRARVPKAAKPSASVHELKKRRSTEK